jgi:hypothetical protein
MVKWLVKKPAGLIDITIGKTTSPNNQDKIWSSVASIMFSAGMSLTPVASRPIAREPLDNRL